MTIEQYRDALVSAIVGTMNTSFLPAGSSIVSNDPGIVLVNVNDEKPFTLRCTIDLFSMVPND